MSKENKNFMPQSGAGLMRFNEDDKSIFQLKPEQVIIGSATIGTLLLLLKFL